MGGSKVRSKMLQEVCLLRLLLIVLLVLYHSFAPFAGGWKPLPCQESANISYLWIGVGAYSLMLECFTFISGYVFGYQVDKNGGGNLLNARNIFLKKFKRLIIPSVIFSLVYMLIFTPEAFASPFKACYSLLEGVGHMWYLPMLYWCFMGIWLIEKANIKAKVAIPALIVLALVSFVPMPFRLTYAMYYMFFFFCGYILKREGIDLSKYTSAKLLILIWILFVTSFIWLESHILELKVLIPSENDHMNKIILMISSKAARMVFSSLGVAAVLLTSVRLLEHKKISLSQPFIKLSTYCFGIYLFQQFILQWFYYRTSWHEFISIGTLPWVGFVVTIILSWLLTHLLLKTRPGRYLIG